MKSFIREILKYFHPKSYMNAVYYSYEDELNGNNYILSLGDIEPIDPSCVERILVSMTTNKVIVTSNAFNCRKNRRYAKDWLQKQLYLWISDPSISNDEFKKRKEIANFNMELANFNNECNPFIMICYWWTETTINKIKFQTREK